MSEPSAAAAHSAAVITVSTRAAAGIYQDRAGPVLVEGLRHLDFQVGEAVVVADGEGVSQALTQALAQGVDLVLTTGGTGVGPADRTPEATAPLIDLDLPGLAEALRRHGVAQGVPTAVLSRGLAGVVLNDRGGAVVVNLPGSVGGCRDGLAVLEPVLPHLISQLRGGDHEAGPG